MQESQARAILTGLMCQKNGRTISEGEGGLTDGREEHLGRE